MLKLIPVLTEKSMKDAKSGKYTFWVDQGLTKYQVKDLVGKTFGVTVKSVKVIKIGPERKRSLTTRHVRQVFQSKKAIVTLGEKDKIDLFEEAKEKKSKKKAKTKKVIK